MCEQEVLYVCVCTVKLHKINNLAYMYYKVLKYKRYRKEILLNLLIIFNLTYNRYNINF